MTRHSRRDVATSVRDRLLRQAKDRGDDFQLVLLRYANERLLFRLSQSKYADQFVLKGAALFTVWSGAPHRATRDIDLLGFGDSSEQRVRQIFRDILAVDVIDDGVDFDAATLDIAPIREDQAYEGVRVELLAFIAAAKIRLQVDVGFGDAVTPADTTLEFPPLLDFPAPMLRAYPRETVVAEKVEALVQLGMANSRMKDFYDLMIISRRFEFEASLVVSALRNTFTRRKTPLPQTVPVALTPPFTGDALKASQWKAFLRKGQVSEAIDLVSAVTEVARFVQQPLWDAANRTSLVKYWPASGPWAFSE